MPTFRVYFVTTVFGALVLLILLYNTKISQSTSESTITNLKKVNTAVIEQFKKEMRTRIRLAKAHLNISKEAQRNQQKTSIYIPDLKLYEEVVRNKFHTFKPNFSDLEQDWHQHCIKTLTRDTDEDHNRYFKDQPKSEQMRRSHLSYLKPDSIVVEIGGNQGHDTSQVIQLYDPYIITLEPIEELAKRLTEQFKDNKKVTVLNFGLGKVANEVFVNVNGFGGEATSMFSTGDTSLIIANTTQFLLRTGAGKFDIDLLLINCEGCEYEVLEAAIESRLINKFKNIQFAAHRLSGVRNQESRYCQIESLLYRTHAPTYRYKYIWEHWKRMDLLGDIGTRI